MLLNLNSPYYCITFILWVFCGRGGGGRRFTFCPFCTQLWPYTIRIYRIFHTPPPIYFKRLNILKRALASVFKVGNLTFWHSRVFRPPPPIGVVVENYKSTPIVWHLINYIKTKQLRAYNSFASFSSKKMILNFLYSRSKIWK